MKRRLIRLVMAGLALAGWVAWNAPVRSMAQQDANQGNYVESPDTDVVRWDQLQNLQEQHAKVYIGHGYVVGGVELQAGKYLVVHTKTESDEGVFFYRVPYRLGQEPAARVRCAPVEAKRAERFSLESSRQPNGTYQVKSIQFAGSTEVHTFERAEVYLGHIYTIEGERLEPGRYLLVHRSDRDHPGVACLFIYRAKRTRGDAPVAMAHCIPINGEQVKELTVRSHSQPDGSSLMVSIQFPGSMEVHTFSPGS